MTGRLQLRGCRRSLEMLGEPQRMRRMVLELEYHLENDASLCFDICKALIEHSCKSILRLTNTGFDAKFDMSDLIREVQKVIELIPRSNPEDRDMLILYNNIGKSMTTMVKGIGELRSKKGLLAHGALDSVVEPALEDARFIAMSTDALIEFLISSSKIYWVNFTSEIKYEDHPSFNDIFYEGSQVREEDEGFLGMFGGDGTEILSIKKSYLLYKIDQEQYTNLLNEFEGDEQ